MEGIMELAKKHDIFVIEDAAQATGADYLFKTEPPKSRNYRAHRDDIFLSV